MIRAHRFPWLASAALAAGLIACGGQGPDAARSNPAPTAPSAAPVTTTTTAVPGQVAELAQLAARANAAVYRVEYRSTTPDGAALRVTSWRKPPRFRQDQRQERSEEIVSTFVLPDGVYICGRQRDAWDCRSFPGGLPPMSSDPAAVASRLGDRLGERITASDRTVSGMAARCFTLAGPPDRGPAAEVETCFSAEGIPILARTGDVAFTAVGYSTDVPDSIFVLPAAAPSDGR